MKGGVVMTFGETLELRMSQLGMDLLALSDLSLVDYDVVKKIVDGLITIEQIDEFELNLISGALHCKPEFFLDENDRNKDLVFSAMNRGHDNKESISAKIKIQDFMEDMNFINEVLSEY